MAIPSVTNLPSILQISGGQSVLTNNLRSIEFGKLDFCIELYFIDAGQPIKILCSSFVDRQNIYNSLLSQLVGSSFGNPTLNGSSGFPVGPPLINFPILDVDANGVAFDLYGTNLQYGSTVVINGYTFLVAEINPVWYSTLHIAISFQANVMASHSIGAGTYDFEFLNPDGTYVILTNGIVIS